MPTRFQWIRCVVSVLLLAASSAVAQRVPTPEPSTAKPSSPAQPPGSVQERLAPQPPQQPSTIFGQTGAPATPTGPMPQLSTFARFAGMKVTAVNFRGLHSPFAEAQIHDLLQQHVGEPLDRNKIRDSIRSLYATGRFAALDVTADEQDGGVAVTFRATENFFYGDIEIMGRPKHAPTETQFINASKLNLGELYSAEGVDQGIGGMQRILEDYGFYRSSISYDVDPHPETQQMDVAFRLSAGKPAKVGNVFVGGNPGRTATQVQRATKLKKGKQVRSNNVQNALSRLRKSYSKSKRLEAQISVEQRKYNPDTNTVDYHFNIDRGPVVDIVAQGVKLSNRKLKKLVPVYEENAVDEDLLNEGRRNIRDYLQTNGYFDAKVEVEQMPAGENHARIVYKVDRGERHKLTNVVINGNKYFRTTDVRERMSIQPASMLVRHGRYSQALLARDVEAISALYRNNGFQQVTVTPRIEDDVSGEKGRMRVTFDIAEGKQTRVESLTIVGTNALTEDQLTQDEYGGYRLSISPGQPYSDFNIASDRSLILNEYFNQGFANAELEPTTSFENGDPTRINVKYTITEGPRVFVDRVIVSGVWFTRPNVVNREFGIRDGMPLSQDRMVDSQRRLYDLGIFNEVNMAVQNPEGTAQYKNLLYNIKEARRWTMNYGLGLEIGTGADVGQGTGPQGRTGVSPNGQFDLTRANFRGKDQTILLKARYGRFVKRGLLSFDSPRFWDLPNWRMTLSTFYDNSRDVNTFASERLEGAAQLQQTIGDPKLNTQMLYRFSYRRVRVDPSSFPAGFTPDLIPLYSRPVRVGMPSLTFLRDHRDNAIESRRGTYFTADVGLANSYFGSEANFGRVLVQHSSYHLLGRSTTPAAKRWILARSTRIGVQSQFRNTTPIPLPEHFFAGGGNSLRGFSVNQAGPRDPSTGGPLGGNGMFVNNIELRFPPTPLPFVQDNLSFIAFHDMGNVFDTAEHMWTSLGRWKQKNPLACTITSSTDLTNMTACDFNYVTHSVGTGIRYRTPIGPIRIDIGYNLNPPVFPIKQGTNPHSETVRRFNFFFSIGQTF